MRELTQTWRDLFLVFRVALDVRKLLVAVLLLLAIGLVVSLSLGALMAATVGYQKSLETAEVLSLDEQAHFANLNLAAENRTFGDIAWGFVVRGNVKDELLFYDVLSLTLADLGIGRFSPRDGADAYYEPTGWTTGKVLLLAAAAIVLWLLTAPLLGSMCRMAAIEIARDERIELGTANAFSRGKWGSLFMAPVLLWMFVLAVFLLIALWGLIGSIPVVGPVLAVLLLPFVLFGGFLMALALLGFVGPAAVWLGVLAAVFAAVGWGLGVAFDWTLFPEMSVGGWAGVLAVLIVVFGGSPLIVPALAVEGTDSFESLSRAYNYFFSRLWHFVAYTIVGTVYGLVCVAFVWAFAAATLALAFLPAQWAWGEPVQRFLWAISPSADVYAVLSLGAPMPLDGDYASIWRVDGVAMWVFAFVGLAIVAVVAAFAAAYAVSYAATMWTMIYFLLRRRVDGTDTQEVFVEGEDEHWLLPPRAIDERLAETATTATSAPAAAAPDEQATPPAEEPADGGSRDQPSEASALEREPGANGADPPAANGGAPQTEASAASGTAEVPAPAPKEAAKVHKVSMPPAKEKANRSAKSRGKSKRK